MYWNFGWVMLSAAAFFLVIVNLMRAVMKKRCGWQALLFISLSCGGLTMLCALRAVVCWTEKRDWSAIEDAAPALAAVCTLTLCLEIGLNLLALMLHMRTEKTQEEAGAHEKG